jgi:hypothetical protein
VPYFAETSNFEPAVFVLTPTAVSDCAAGVAAVALAESGFQRKVVEQQESPKDFRIGRGFVT